MNQPSVTPASPDTHAATPRPSWGETLRAYLEPASLRMFALGFAAGLPLLLVLGTLSFRLREAGLVDCERRGTYVYYWINPEALGTLSTLLAVG